MRALLQYTLDLFGAEPKKPAAPPAPPVPTGKPNAGATPATATTATTALPVPVPHFAHPRANRELSLGLTRVAYEFKRGRRRTIGFSVGPQGLEVRAPTWVSLREVDAALRDKADWIVSKLGQTQERQALLDSRTIDWRDGVCLPFMGEVMTVVLTPGALVEAVGSGRKFRTVSAVPHRTPTSDSRLGATAADLPAQPESPVAPPMRLQLGLPTSASPDQIRDAVQAWLLQQARGVFAERLNHFAARLQVQWRKLSLSNAGTRWGSAKSDGSIRLHWRLIHFSPDVIDYVVAHELSHLRVMDHSPRFWATVESVIPDYAVLRAQLKEESLPRWQ